MDISYNPDLGILRSSISSNKGAKFPAKPVLQKELMPMIENLSKSNMRSHLETFTGFYTRYYKSDYGAKSSAWLLETVNQTIADAGANKYGAYAKPFIHPWGQNSVIAT